MNCSDKDSFSENTEVLNWLLEDKNPEVRLRVLKEYLGLADTETEVMKTKQELMNSPVFIKAMDLLNSDKTWSKYDAITSFAEWGLTRKDLDIDAQVFSFLEKTGFKPMCGEGLLLRNLVKLGYYNEEKVKEEVNTALRKIKEDGGFGCLSKSKKINDPKLPHKSCARITSNYLLLAAEMKRQGMPVDCEKELVHYFMKRNVIYRMDDKSRMVVEGFESTYYPPDAIMNGVQNLLYALSILGAGKEENCNHAWNFLYRQKGEDGRYILEKTKTTPCFKVGTKGKPNKWVTLYALMSEKYCNG